MADTFSDIAKNASSMSVSELGASLLGRKEAVEKSRRKRDRKDMRIAQVLGVLTAGQGLFKNAFKRRQKELANVKTLDLLNVEEDAKQIEAFSSILNVVPEGYTKEINPLTDKVYTVDENVKRFFGNPTTAEAFIDKVSPVFDQQIKFSPYSNMQEDNASLYQIVQERGAQDIFKYMITDNRHLSLLEGLEELYQGTGTDGPLTREELIQKGLGITSKKLSSLKTNRYAKMERDLRDRPGLFNPKTYLNIFKSIGNDRAADGELNIFQSLTEKDLSAPKMTEILETINLKGMVVPAFDKAMKEARLSPDRYLAKVRSPKYENQRTNMSSVVLLTLNDEIQIGKSFEKYGLEKYIDDGTMADMAKYLGDTTQMRLTFETRAVGLSERLKYDKAFGITLYKEANPHATPKQLAEFVEDLKSIEFRNKFSALAVLKAGIVDVGFSTTEEWAPNANTTTAINKDGVALAMRDIGKVSKSDFDRKFEEDYGVNAAKMADKIDPLISPMFKPTGEVTEGYHDLPSNVGKIIAYDMQVNMVMSSQLNEQQKGERLEKFFNITPNPRGAPDVDSYIEQMAQEQLQEEMDAAPEGTIFQETFGLAPADKIRRKAFQDEAIDSSDKRKARLLEVTNALDTLPSKPSAGSIFTTTRTQQKQAKANFDRAAVVKGILKEKYNITPGAVSGVLVSGKAKGELSNLLNTDPSSYEDILNLINAYNNNEEINKEDYLDKPTEEIETESIDFDITKPRAVGEDVIKAAINAVVDIQGVSDEYKQITKNFLGYVAKAESNYGLNENTFNNERDAWGPMQIIMSQSLAEIQRRLNPKLEVGKPIREYNELLKDNLNIDLNNITKEDLEQPVVSAAVARAYFMVTVEAIPTEPEAMADYYVDNYVRFDPKSPTYKEDREEARQNFLVNNGFVRGGIKQTVKSLFDI